MSDLETQILKNIKSSMGKAIETELVGYNKPLSKLTERVVNSHEVELYDLINAEFSEMLNSKDFKDELKIAINSKFAKVLVARMGGEIEKRVNEMKSDPIARAKITLALDKIISEI